MPFLLEASFLQGTGERDCGAPFCRKIDRAKFKTSGPPIDRREGVREEERGEKEGTLKERILTVGKNSQKGSSRPIGHSVQRLDCFANLQKGGGAARELQSWYRNEMQREEEEKVQKKKPGSCNKEKPVWRGKERDANPRKLETQLFHET